MAVNKGWSEKFELNKVNRLLNVKMKEKKMEFKYRYLSEEKAIEIDAMGFTNTIGTKLCANSGECVTNDDETIIFRQIWCSREENIPNEYFLLYKGHYYFINMFLIDIREKMVEDFKCLHYIFDVSQIYNTTHDVRPCSIKEIVTVLKSVLFIKYQYGKKNRKLNEEVDIEVLYKGENI